MSGSIVLSDYQDTVWGADAFPKTMPLIILISSIMSNNYVNNINKNNNTNNVEL